MTSFPARLESIDADNVCVARPIYFSSGTAHIFGWLHMPTTVRKSTVGAVICNPFGYEAICAHRSVREFARAIAGNGIPTLRFDYQGTGDSSDVDENADQLKLWVQDIVAAIRTLKSRCGVDRISLVGIRLGALLATLAAAQSEAVDSLVLVGPIVSGRRYVRDLRTTQLAGVALSGASETGVGPHARNTNVLEAGGFSLSEATLKSLAKVELTSERDPPVRSMLILDSDKLASARRWVEALSKSTIRLEYNALPGLIEMVMTAPQFASVPRIMIETTRRWLVSIAGPIEELPHSPGSTGEITKVPEEVLRIVDPGSPQTAITERPVFLSDDTSLFGIVTEPSPDENRRRAVILLNAGADFHIGASRMYVSLARRWARRGYVVLRLDFAGIGDSATRRGKLDDEVFPDEAVVDVKSAIEFLRSHYNIIDMTLAGLCSGAYHALRAAAEGANVNRILMVNPQNYFWEKGMTLDQLQLAEVVHNPSVYRQRILSLGAWSRIFTGQVDIRRIGVIYFQRLRLACEAVFRDLARSIHLKLPQDLGLELKKIVARGVRVIFVFARGEPGIDLLRLQAGSTVTRLKERCRIRIVDSGDHIFSRRGPRSLMENVLSEELFARADGDATNANGPYPPPDLRQASVK